MTKTIVATVPVAIAKAVNAALEAQGFGPNNFSIPARTGTGDATHALCHCWPVIGFPEAIDALALQYPGLLVADATETSGGETWRVDTGHPAEMIAAHTRKHAMAWEGADKWYQNPIMTGATRTYDGKQWVSLMDYNVWAPPIGWREVVATGYPAWVQPVGAVDAYPLGAKVLFNGKNYESVIAANVWSPTVYPAGWKAI